MYIRADGLLDVFEHPSVTAPFQRVAIEVARLAPRTVGRIPGIPLTLLRQPRVFPVRRRELQPFWFVRLFGRVGWVTSRYRAPVENIRLGENVNRRPESTQIQLNRLFRQNRPFRHYINILSYIFWLTGGKWNGKF